MCGPSENTAPYPPRLGNQGRTSGDQMARVQVALDASHRLQDIRGPARVDIGVEREPARARARAAKSA